MAKYRKKGQIDVYEKEKSSGGCGVVIGVAVIIFIIYAVVKSNGSG